MTAYEIQVIKENCTGCLRCQLGCSYQYTRAFNPLAAYIRVDMSRADGPISFTPECTKCGICVEHCFYGALQKKSQERDT